MPNGYELPVLGPQAQVSGRGLLPHKAFLEPTSRSSLASTAESPVHSSELLGGPAGSRICRLTVSRFTSVKPHNAGYALLKGK